MSQITQTEAIARLQAAIDDPNHNPKGFWESLLGFKVEMNTAMYDSDPKAPVFDLWRNALLALCDAEVEREGVEALIDHYRITEDGHRPVYDAASMSDLLFEIHEENLFGHLIA